MKTSIALCTYNGEGHLPEQLNSYLRQELKPDELVVCDDGSTDGTIRILEDFRKSASFPVILKRNPENLGFIKNFEQCAGLCTGDIILYSDQDDFWLPDKVALVHQAFAENPKAGALISDAQIVDEKLTPTGKTLWQKMRFHDGLQRPILQGRAMEALIRSNVAFLGMTIAFRASYKDALIPFAHWGHDRWTILLIALLADIALIKKPTALYRQHDRNTSGGLRQEPAAKRLESTVLSERTRSRKNAFLGRAKIYQALEERATALNQAAKYQPRHVHLVKGKISHLHARAQMPSNRLSRAPFVARELLTGRYFKYSEGFRAAVKDLLERDAAKEP